MHYILLDGSSIACNDVGNITWAAFGSEWVITVESDLLANTNGTVVRSFTFDFPSAPPSIHSVRVSPSNLGSLVVNAGTQYEVLVTPSVVTLGQLDTVVFLEVYGDMMVLALASANVTSGLAFDGGCSLEDNPSLTPSQPACLDAGLSEPFLSFCNYDLVKGAGDDIFVNMSVGYQSLFQQVNGLLNPLTTFTPTAAPEAPMGRFDNGSCTVGQSTQRLSEGCLTLNGTSNGQTLQSLFVDCNNAFNPSLVIYADSACNGVQIERNNRFCIEQGSLSVYYYCLTVK